ncbi:hypothetical protein AJ79_08074 [Helicocarpus griseus UAMH5409]|uniref:HNH nuclease domain-containing protein n=1 Tax=Helicocarpus griseus UAMH5409 TaxID=1447875 RepID=A0A2B7WWE8_9EURO|nr:hypothetical protein AJ79_08074 [Helicocarpus griseus UAMH5409]
MAWHRHQTSLEDTQPLAADRRAEAKRRFYSIITHFTAEESSDAGYSRPLLVGYMYEYSRSELSQDTFLRTFFDFMDLDITAEHDPDFEIKEDRLIKASGQRTTQPSPAHLSAIQRVQGGNHEYLPTPDRISHLRGVCLIRNHHRCVSSRQFDKKEAIIRLTNQGDSARDDEGNQLRGQPFTYLEVAHIIPHSLTQSDADGQLSDSQKAALMILNMFDCDVSHIIGGVNIDRPFNAMSLTPDLHTDFGNFSVFFEPVLDQEHTYQIDTFLPAGILPALPVTRTLYLTSDRSIDPPSPRLLAIHRPIAYILHLSGAGDYIDKILQDMEEIGAQEGGSTELGRLVTLRLGGWFDGAVSA